MTKEELSEKRKRAIESLNNIKALLGLDELYIDELEAQIEKMKSVVISERDEALRVEDIITYGVLNDVLDKWEIKENDRRRT